jgi:GT2 family glycosyltransferase
MLDYLKTLPGAGVIGCKLLNSDLSVQTSCIQKFPTILNQITDIEWFRLRWPHCRLWEIGPLFSTIEKPARVEMISGACMMLKRDVFEQAGMFSEEYFMYADDLDLSYKVVQKGFINYYVGNVTVIHHGGKSTAQKANQWATIMKFRAKHRFFIKTRGQLYGALFRTAMACVASGRLVLLGLLALLCCGMRGEKSIRSVSAKWNAVLAWAVGLDNWVLNMKLPRRCQAPNKIGE